MKISTDETEKRKSVLLLYGGWEGHYPELFADFAENELLTEFEVVRSQDLNILNSKELADFDCMIPIWTFGNITKNQEESFINSVADGLGLVAWHGITSAFLESRIHKFMLGGQFVCHPGGDKTTYQVHFHDNDPLVADLEDVTVTSEQYYLLIDPAVKVLASTSIVGEGMQWVRGVQMPVAWKRNWGKGRVFYCALGHKPDQLKLHSISLLLKRAIHWAARKPDSENIKQESLQ